MGSSRLDHGMGYHDSYHSVSYTASQSAGCRTVLAYDAASHRVSCSVILHKCHSASCSNQNECCGNLVAMNSVSPAMSFCIC